MMISNMAIRANMPATMRRLGELIEESGCTDKEISKLMGLSVQSVNKWRHGYSFPDIENLYTLSKILGVCVDDIFVPENGLLEELSGNCRRNNIYGKKINIMAYYWMIKGLLISHKCKKESKTKQRASI